MKTVIVTGGAGFIGATLVRHLLATTDWRVINIDKLTYAGNLESLKTVADNPRHVFSHTDICERATLDALFSEYQPDGVMHLAAESHVDRAIQEAADFIQTNIVGTYTLLETARHYWLSRDTEVQQCFRFLHVSTDEVFGSLGAQGQFDEASPYAPRSPYSASKAAADHLVRAWHHTYGLPVVLSNCTNNYGPGQFPEKLIPLFIRNALAGNPLPIYGDGQQVRDWLYVEDHVRALTAIFAQGRIGETYCVGGSTEYTNQQIAEHLCALLDELAPRRDGQSYRQQITYVPDRPGHDRRYALNSHKLQQHLNWQPLENFDDGLRKTVRWYLDHPDWPAAS